MKTTDRELMQMALWALEQPHPRFCKAVIWELRNRLAQKKRITVLDPVETNAITLGDLNDAQRFAA